MTPDWRFEAKRRYNLLNDDQKADYTARKTGIDTSDPTAVFELLDSVDPVQTVSVPELIRTDWGDKIATALTPPDEGGLVALWDIEDLEARYEALGLDAKLWTGTLVAQGNRTHSFRIRDKATVRRYEIYRGILALAEWGSFTSSGVTEDECLRAIVHLVTGDDAALWPTQEPGRLLASLDAAQATTFADIAVDLAQDRYLVEVDEDGTLRLKAAV